MDSTSPNLSPDSSYVRPSFRKPLNDAASRKYRRHSPVNGPDSSSSDGSHKYEQDLSPKFSKEDHKKMDDRRRDDGREVDREFSRSRNGRVSDSPRRSDRKNYANSDNPRRNDDYNRHYRSTDDEDRTYHRSSRSGQESKSGNRYEHTREEGYSERYRDHGRSADKYSRDKYESGGHNSKDKERDVTVLEHHRLSAKDSSSDRAALGSRYSKSYKESSKTGDRYRHGDKGGWEDKRDRHRSPIDYKDESTSLEGQKDILYRGKHDEREYIHDDREYDRRKEKYSREPMEDTQNGNKRLSSFRERDVSETQVSSIKKPKSNYPEKTIVPAEVEKPPSSSSPLKDTAVNAKTDPSGTASQAENAQDLNAAKVAAMKAAELVNRNLVGGACLSTDQKKKLLWGKKNAPAEESGNRWDLTLFPDRERQEKFNKLMGVKGDVKLEHKPEDKDGSLQAEKQKELQLDLEKQYTAGLRRRDGRTVGLGL